jgi:serine/threonine protein kinase
LLDAKKRAFIGDLGSSRIFSSLQSVNQRRDITIFVGTPIWMSPEMLRANTEKFQKFQPIKSDIFSLGLIALYCLDAAEFAKEKTLQHK